MPNITSFDKKEPDTAKGRSFENLLQLRRRVLKLQFCSFVLML
ncbi:conserved hypothetical protein [Treponema phagedenis]|uniref:Uncharacterized protein n=1 Tax=Treponema phagedenis TaxID=162 RepID=A0A0B7GVG4_TREPH|nr:hypothetical protein HMPREF9554_01735 [Treponema phagedenis F0421]CEM60955.1 conserved hypothetical protein [Treponema phagedenis]